MACFRPTFRTTPTAGVEQNTPIFTTWHSECRRVSSYGKVAHRHELAPGGCGYALDSRDHWLRNLSERDHHPAAGVEQALLPALVFGVSTHLLEVMPSAKAFSLRGEDHNSH